MDRYELRRNDYSLDPHQEELRQAVADFLTARCDIDLVRRSAPPGADPELWEGGVALGLSRMVLPDAMGGIGAGLTEVLVVAEELGRALAPLPLIEHAVASRVLQRLGLTGEDMPQWDDERWDQPLGLGLRSLSDGRMLVAAGAAARSAVVATDDAIELWTRTEPGAHVGDGALLPTATWGEAPDRHRLAEGPKAQALRRQAVTEWKLLTAAALTGMSAAALDDAVDFARTRFTRGVPIGSLQGISHPLATVAIEVASCRNLVRRATWMHEHEPGARPDLPPAAWAYATRAAQHAVETAVHVQGGQGFTLEASVSLYFLAVRELAGLPGDVGADVLAVVDGLDAVSATAHAVGGR